PTARLADPPEDLLGVIGAVPEAEERNIGPMTPHDIAERFDGMRADVRRPVRQEDDGAPHARGGVLEHLRREVEPGLDVRRRVDGEPPDARPDEAFARRVDAHRVDHARGTLRERDDADLVGGAARAWASIERVEEAVDRANDLVDRLALHR